MGTYFQETKSERIAVAAEIRRRYTRRDDVRTILEWLVADHGFTLRNDKEPARLNGLGVSCSCTSGLHGLLANWCAAVDRKEGGTHA